MNREAFLALSATLSIAILGIFTVGERAAAQPIRQCETMCYHVDPIRLQGVSGICWQLCIRTQWANGVLGPNIPPCYSTGEYLHRVPAGPGRYSPSEGHHLQLPSPATPASIPFCQGCQLSLCATVRVDAHGCLNIKVYPDPCPSTSTPLHSQEEDRDR
jgi:hypothetical protein